MVTMTNERSLMALQSFVRVLQMSMLEAPGIQVVSASRKTGSGPIQVLFTTGTLPSFAPFYKRRVSSGISYVVPNKLGRALFNNRFFFTMNWGIWLHSL